MSLGELIDKYHKHEATKDHDKIYALLGMASSQSREQFVPDYEVLWSKLLEKVISYPLGGQVQIYPWPLDQRAEIHGKGHVLGTLKMTRRDLTGIQYVEVWRRPDSNRRKDLLDEWILPMTASSVRDGEIVCLLQGASRPTIIRPYSDSQHSYDLYDHFLIVMIESNPMSDSRPEHPLHDFLLVWDWSQDSGTKSHAQQALDRVCGKSTRLLHSTLILKDAGTRGWGANENLRQCLRM
jgi:hypothetical protein